jgi:hypothetical protein
MLNIAGISSAPESIPSNSGNSIDTQHKRPTRDWLSSTDSGIPRNSFRFPSIPEFRQSRNWTEILPIPTDFGTPGIGFDSGTANRNHTIHLTHICDVVLISYFIWIRSNFGTEFRESRNSFRFRKLTEFDQLSSACRMLCVDRVPGIERNRFRCGIDSFNVQHCGIGWLLYPFGIFYTSLGSTICIGSEL